MFRFGLSAIVRSVAALPDNKHFWSASGDNTLKLWHRARKRPVLSVQAHNGYIRGLGVSADGREVLTAAADGTARVWNRSEIEAARRWPEPHQSPVTFIGILADGKHVISAEFDGGVHVRSLTNGHLASARFTHLNSQCRSAAMTPDGRSLLLCGDQSVFTLRLSQDIPVEIGSVEMPNNAAITTDGHLGICDGFSGTVMVWDLEHGKHVRALLRARNGSDSVSAVAIALDGRYAFASVVRHGLYVWDLRRGGNPETRRPNKHDRLLVAAPDGKHLVCVTDKGQVEIVTIPKGRLVRSFDAGPVVSMALSPSGRYLVTGTLHATVQIWNVITGACLVAYGADSVITAVALGRDHAGIVIGDDVGRLQMLRLNRMRLP